MICHMVRTSRVRVERARPCGWERTVNYPRFPLLSVVFLLFGCSSGDAGVTPPTQLDQSPPLSTTAAPTNTNAPPLSATALPCNGSTSPAEFAQLTAGAMCAQAQACTQANAPADVLEALGRLCLDFGNCAANIAACPADALPPTLPMCDTDVKTCLTAFMAALGCQAPDDLKLADVPACSRLAPFVPQGSSSTSPEAGTRPPPDGGTSGCAGNCTCVCASGTLLIGLVGGACTCNEACSRSDEGSTGTGTCT
jgi:hypothetical protein